MRNGNSYTIYNSKNIKINPAKNIYIQNRIWVEYGVTILKGTIIESNCIISTQSIVTGYISSGVIAVGNPTKIIKCGGHWRREKN